MCYLADLDITRNIHIHIHMHCQQTAKNKMLPTTNRTKIWANAHEARESISLTLQTFCLGNFGENSLFKMCVAAWNREKFTKTPYFGFQCRSRSSMLVPPKKMVSSACYDEQHVCVYLQPFSCYIQHCWLRQIRVAASLHYLVKYKSTAAGFRGGGVSEKKNANRPFVWTQARICFLHSLIAVSTTFCSRLHLVTSWVHRHS